MKKNVLIIGSRGVGKTTLLSLFSSEVKKLLDQQGYELKVDHSGEKKLESSLNDLSLMLESPYVIHHHIEATADIKHYKYAIKEKNNKKSLVEFNIIDHPGGYFSDDHYKTKLLTLFEKSNIIIHAIDSPYLIEENGRYNASRNQSTLLEEIIKNSEETLKGKAVLFALLKCERYNESQLHKTFDLNYYSTIDLVKKIPNLNYKVLPIETVGGIIFEKFSLNVKSELPEPIFMRKHPNSKMELKNVDVFSMWLINNLLEDVKNQKFMFFKTKKAKQAQKLVKVFERML